MNENKIFIKTVQKSLMLVKSSGFFSPLINLFLYLTWVI